MRMSLRPSCLAVLLMLCVSPTGAVMQSPSTVTRITEIYLSPFDMAGPTRIAVGAGRKRAYALSSIPNRLWVLDTGTNQQVASFATGGSIPSDVAVDPQAGRVYVTNVGSAFISVLDAASNTWLAPLDIGVPSQRIALQPGRNRAYVTTDGRTVLLVDLGSGSVLKTIRDRGFATTRAVVVDPRRPRAYVQNAGNTGISVINTLTDRVIDTIDIGHVTNALALDPASRRLYVGNDDGTLSVVRTTNDADAVLANIPVGSGISDVAVDPGRHRAYVADFLDNTVAEVDTQANVVVGSTPVGIDPEGIAVDTASGREFVASYSADYVSVLGE